MTPLVCALVLATALAVPQGGVQRFSVWSPTLGGTRTIRVYLPPSYGRPEAAQRRYPVVYLLHGWPGSDGNWFGPGQADRSADTLIAQGRMPEVVLVCPNGNCGLLARTLYMNAAQGDCRMEDYVLRDVVTWVDTTFRTVAESSARGILGLSDGGTGALNFAFLHPETFGACASLSADLVLDPKGFGLGRVLGRTDAARRIADHSPELNASKRVDQLKTQVIYFDCGASDESIEENRAFHRTLVALGVPHTWREFPGSHTWGYWRKHLRDALPAITARMPGAPSETTPLPEGTRSRGPR
jgi:putative tributyrin esterase